MSNESTAVRSTTDVETIPNLHLMCNDCQCEVQNMANCKNSEKTNHVESVCVSANETNDNTLQSSKLLCAHLDMLQEQLAHCTTRGELTTANEQNAKLNKELNTMKIKHKQKLRNKKSQISDLMLRVSDIQKQVNVQPSSTAVVPTEEKVIRNVGHSSSTHDTSLFASKWNISKSSLW